MRSILGFGKKEIRAIEDRKPSDNPMKAVMSALSGFAKRGNILPQANRVIDANRATSHQMIYRCLNKIGTSVQAVHWYVERDPDYKGSDKPNENLIQVIQDALNSPNDSMDGISLRYWLAINFALMSSATMKVGFFSGEITGIYPLNGNDVSLVSDKFGNIVEYEYGKTSEKIKIPSFSKVKKNEKKMPMEAFAFRIFKPSLSGNVNEVMSPLAALGMPAEISSALLQRAYDTATGESNVRKIYNIENGDQQIFDDVQSFVSEAEVGAEESGKNLIVSGAKVNVIDVDPNMSDIHSKMPLDDMSRQIAGVFDVPVALVSLSSSDSAKFASNYIESRKSFYEDTIIPSYLVPIESVMTQFCCPKGLRIRFDRDTIPALVDSRIKNAKELSGVDFLSENEKREMIGYQPRKVEVEK